MIVQPIRNGSPYRSVEDEDISGKETRRRRASDGSKLLCAWENMAQAGATGRQSGDRAVLLASARRSEGASERPASTQPAKQESFEQWWKDIAGLEGTLEQWKANGANRFDRGGRTNYGITESTFMAYAGAASLPKTREAFEHMTLGQAKVIAKAIWRVSQAHKIDNPGVAIVVADWFWGSNANSWGRIKAALRELGHDVPRGKNLDPQTIEVLNSLPPGELIDKLSDARRKHHEDIVRTDHTQKKFLEGWQRRTGLRQGQAQRYASIPPRGNPAIALHHCYVSVLSEGNIPEAARLLNGFNSKDILEHLAQLSPAQVAALHRAAVEAPGVGPTSQIATITRAPYVSYQAEEALRTQDWPQAALFLNACCATELESHLSKLTERQISMLHEASLETPSLGPDSQIAKRTNRGHESQ